MAWNTLTTFADGGTPTATLMNLYLDNMEWLHAPPTAKYELGGTTNLTTTSTTWGTITGFSTALVTSGGNIFALFSGAIDNLEIDLSVDGTRLCSTGSAGTGSIVNDGATLNLTTHNLPVLYSTIAAGTHTFAVEWKATAATGTLYADYQPRFDVREL